MRLRCSLPAVNAFPSEEYRRALGERIDLTEQQVQVRPSMGACMHRAEDRASGLQSGTIRHSNWHWQMLVSRTSVDRTSLHVLHIPAQQGGSCFRKLAPHRCRGFRAGTLAAPFTPDPAALRPHFFHHRHGSSTGAGGTSAQTTPRQQRRRHPTAQQQRAAAPGRVRRRQRGSQPPQ